MTMNRWMTKDEVISDLNQMMGLEALDEQFIIQGARPPPPRRDLEQDDDEFRLRYGDYGNQCEAPNGPDLAGITHMLRMVDEATRQPKERLNWRQRTPEERTNCSLSSWRQAMAPPTRQNREIVISKLNPNVPSFDPKTPPRKKETTPLEPLNSEDKNTEVPKVIIINNVIGTVEPKSQTQVNVADDHDAKAEELKRKIIEASRADRKREKNVAMAALLRLKSSPQTFTPKTASPVQQSVPSSDSSSPKDLVLQTPQYFQGGPVPDVPAPDSDTPKVEREDQTELAACDQPSVNQIEESVEKVLNWRTEDSPKPAYKKPQPPPLYTGPCSFKKKSTSPAPSPAPSWQSRGTNPDPLPTYRPSKYAAQLAKQYEERSKARQAPTDMWTKLEQDLKAKDEEVRNRKLKSQDPNASFSSESSKGSRTRRR